MADPLQYLLTLPPWVAIPIILVTLIVTYLPNIYQVFHNLNTENREYQNERRRLELLKLRYEIEAICKTNDLKQISEQVLPVEKSLSSDPSAKPSVPFSLSFWQRFLYGALGAFLPFLIFYSDLIL